MIKNEIGGNKLILRYGVFLKRVSDYFSKVSNHYIKKGSVITISNPTHKFVNPFTIIINFTINNCEKYQLVHQGNFKDRYKLINSDSSDKLND